MRRRVIDASGLILGRMASRVAKRLLEGEWIEIVNAEKAVVSGKRLSIIKRYKEFLEVGGEGRGPMHWRRPDRILRKTIRGMLPHRQWRGKRAMRRLRVHIGVPEELRDVERETIPEAHISRLQGPYITVGEIAESIGWRR